jgi:hypothetical protein
MVMNEFQVTCINKPDRTSRHEHITHIGNTAGEWRLSREITIQKIDANSEAFYTIDKTTSLKMYIGVVREQGKTPFLRSYADGKWNDNLLAQAECTAACKIIG